MAVATQGHADPNPYVIKKIKKSIKLRAYVDNAWQGNVQCIQANLRVAKDLGGAKFYVKAYFYDDKKNKIAEYRSPSQVSDDHHQYYSIPAILAPGKTHEAYFPIPAGIKKGARKWRQVLVVFGDAEYATAELYPNRGLKIAAFDFPEKKIVLGDTGSSSGKAVTFRYAAPRARSVNVAGDFNDWSGDPMTRDSRGTWTKTMDLAPGTYAYKFVVNGNKWVIDPNNPSRKMIRGSQNSIVTVE